MVVRSVSCCFSQGSKDRSNFLLTRLILAGSLSWRCHPKRPAAARPRLTTSIPRFVDRGLRKKFFFFGNNQTNTTQHNADSVWSLSLSLFRGRKTVFGNFFWTFLFYILSPRRRQKNARFTFLNKFFARRRRFFPSWPVLTPIIVIVIITSSIDDGCYDTLSKDNIAAKERKEIFFLDHIGLGHRHSIWNSKKIWDNIKVEKMSLVPYYFSIQRVEKDLIHILTPNIEFPKL